jgi:hypothetical protein
VLGGKTVTVVPVISGSTLPQASVYSGEIVPGVNETIVISSVLLLTEQIIPFSVEVAILRYQVVCEGVAGAYIFVVAPAISVKPAAALVMLDCHL